MRLVEEMQNDRTASELIEGLQEYHRRRRPPDGVEGLERKLRAAERENEILDGSQQKEMFAKLLAKWSLTTFPRRRFSCTSCLLRSMNFACRF